MAPSPQGTGPSTRYDASVARGALVNALGLLGKLLYPLLFLVISRLCGPERLGLYLLATSVAEIGISAVQTGFVDAMLVYASRHVDQAELDAREHDHLYRVLALCFALPLCLSAAAALALHFGAPALVDTFYPNRPSLAPALRIVGYTLPLIALTEACIGATKVRLHMEYDALLNGLARPVLLISLSVLFYRARPTLESLMLAQLATYVVVAALALRGFARHYGVRELLAAVRSFPWHRELVSFAFPQSLNLSVNKYLTRVDLMMLGALGASDFDLGLYGSAALITQNIREVRLVFSSALGPVLARLHAAHDRDGFEAVLGRVTRWSTTLAMPVVLLAGVLHADLLGLVDASYVPHDSRFMIVLLVPPLVSCAFGLVGNCIVYTGHAGYNLLNGILVAALNTLFNWLLIPSYGLMGAALGTALAAGIVAALQGFELWRLETVRVRAADVYQPHVGFLLCLAVACFLGDPAKLPSFERACLAVLLPVGFGLTMLALGHEEARRTVRRLLALG